MYAPQKHNDSSLIYTQADCLGAVSASPENKKARHYLDLADACQVELYRRQTIRMYRRYRNSLRDPLTAYGVRSRWQAKHHNAMTYRLYHEACIALALGN
mgnify:CR=1 FL=1